MKKYETIYKELRKKYSDEEIAESMLIPEDMTAAERNAADEELRRLGLKMLKEQTEEGIVYAQMPSKKRHAIDYTLDALEPQLPPQQFFRLNRKVVANIRAVQSVSPYFSGRLILKLSPPPSFDVTVSRDRANDFKNWLGG